MNRFAKAGLMVAALGAGMLLMSVVYHFRILEGAGAEARFTALICSAVGIVSGGAALVLLLRCLLQALVLLLRCLLQALLRSCPSEIKVPVAQAAKYCNRSLASFGLILSLIFLLLGLCWSIIPQLE